MNRKEILVNAPSAEKGFWIACGLFTLFLLFWFSERIHLTESSSWIIGIYVSPKEMTTESTTHLCSHHYFLGDGWSLCQFPTNKPTGRQVSGQKVASSRPGRGRWLPWIAQILWQEKRTLTPGMTFWTGCFFWRFPNFQTWYLWGRYSSFFRIDVIWMANSWTSDPIYNKKIAMQLIAGSLKKQLVEDISYFSPDFFG